MPELRRDPVVGYWTIISTERGRRPIEFHAAQPKDAEFCPFCEGQESQTPQELYSIRRAGSAPNAPGWETRVILSKRSMLDQEKPLEHFGDGMYDLMNGVGRHEIIVECAQHRKDIDELEIPQIEKIIATYVERLRELEKDERLKYALLFKNHGQTGGNSREIVRHSRSQIVGMPIVPKRVKEELVAAKSYFDRRERCVFCDILKQEMAEGIRVVAQNDSFLAFCPFASRHPFETWILPKKHSADFWKLEPASFHDFAVILKEALSRLRGLLNDPPYNFILHTAPYRRRKKEGQWKTIDEDYHWYLLISPRLTRSAGFEWGTGIHINPTPPEDAALLLREAH